MNDTNKHYANKWNTILKYNNLSIKQNIIIFCISNKLGVNSAIIIPANKSNVIVLTYNDNIIDETSEFINNNNIHI